MFSWLWQTKPSPSSVRAWTFEGPKMRRIKGWLRVEDGQLVFGDGTDRIAMPLAGIGIFKNRWTGGPLRITSRSLPGRIFFTKDDAILKDEALLAHADFREQIKKCKVYGYRLRRWFRRACIALLLLFVFWPSFRNTTVGYAIQYLPAKYDHCLGDPFYRSICEKGMLLRDAEVMQRLDPIVQPMLDAIPENECELCFQVHLVVEPSANAFAVPGGHVFVTTGLILAAQSPEEIAGVLGHEMGHVSCRHGVRTLVENIGTAVLLQSAMGRTEVSDDSAQELVMELSALKYSRDHEREADMKALEYLHRARISPAGILSFFKRLSNEPENIHSGTEELAQNFLSSHPLPADRWEHLSEEASRAELPEGGFVVLDVDLKALKTRVKVFQDRALKRVP